eukprot:5004302-Amphidinium_carterae.1
MCVRAAPARARRHSAFIAVRVAASEDPGDFCACDTRAPRGTLSHVPKGAYLLTHICMPIPRLPF